MKQKLKKIIYGIGERIAYFTAYQLAAFLSLIDPKRVREEVIQVLDETDEELQRVKEIIANNGGNNTKFEQKAFQYPSKEQPIRGQSKVLIHLDDMAFFRGKTAKPERKTRNEPV